MKYKENIKSLFSIIKFSKILILLLVLMIYSVQAHNKSESGFPLIDNYLPKEYGANQQIWTISQDNRGIMYFGNQKGLLEFDDADWRLYSVPNQSVVRSLANGDDGKIYAGAQGDLGYFLPDSLGKLVFHSLMDFVPKNERDFSDVWNTFVSNDKVYFNTAKYILIWDIKKEEFKIIRSSSAFHVIFKVRGSIYVREFGKGLEAIKNDTVSLLKGGEKFADERIYVMLPFPGENGKLLIGTRKMGFFKYDGNNFIPFKTDADKFINENLIYFPGTVLSDDNILIGTINGGAVVIDTTGKVIRIYNKESGISSNTIYFTLQDHSGAIWLATGNGISRIDYASPVSYFDSRNNFSVLPNDIIRYKKIIYTATNNGIYYLVPQTNNFKLVKNSINQSFTFLKAENELLVGTFNGLFKVDKDKLYAIRKTVGNEYIVHALRQSQINKNRIYVGAIGVWSVLKNGNKWLDEGQILNITDVVNSIVEDKDGKLWIGTNTSGVFSIKFKKDSKGNIILSNPVIEHFDHTNGLQSGQVWVDKFNGQNYFSSTDSIYKFDKSKKIFYTDVSDKIISASMEMLDHKSLNVFQQDCLGRLWLGTERTLAMGKPQMDGTYKWITAPFKRFSDEQINRVYIDNNEIGWFLTSSSIIRYNFKKKNLINTDYTALITKVEIGADSSIYFGGKLSGRQIPLISFKNNSIKFNYSAASYEGKNTNQFKTLLEGFDKTWSSWSVENTKEYTNLPPGKYTFNVEAKNILGNESKKGIYSFKILPPWYRTWWAYAFYVLVLGFGIFIADRTQRRRLVRKERQRAEFREAKLQAQATEAENKALQAENENKLKELEHAKEIEEAYKELKSTQAQLIHSEKMASLGELTAGIAHEIKNPLNFVNNFSEISGELLDDINKELENNNKEEVLAILIDLKQNLEKINQHGKRADSIVKGMLLHSRGTSGEKILTDINDLLDQYVNLAYHGMRAQNKEFNITIEKDYDTTLEKINIVPQDISRVFLNIINNACYAAYDKKKKSSDNNFSPTLRVSTKQLNDKVEIKIGDNGDGIPKDIIDKIFQPFFTTKPTGEGTGLGLSLSYDIVKAHGGTINIQSEPNKETVFTIILST